MNFDTSVKCPEEKLWFAVLLDVTKDAVRGNRRALDWFFSPEFKGDRDFVCSFAGINSENYAKQLAKRIYGGKEDEC